MIGVFIRASNMPRCDPFPKDFNEFKARIKITCIPPPHLCNFRFTHVSLLGQKDCCLTEVCKPLILNWSATLSDICTAQKTATFPSQPARLSHRHRLQPPATLVPRVPSNWADLFAEDVQPYHSLPQTFIRRLPHPSMAFGMGATNPPCLQFSQRHQAPQGVLEDKNPWENIQKIWESLCHDNFRGFLYRRFNYLWLFPSTKHHRIIYRIYQYTLNLHGHHGSSMFIIMEYIPGYIPVHILYVRLMMAT